MHWLFVATFGLATVSAANFHQTPCTLPPDFWCDNPRVAIHCTGSLKFCDSYRRSRSGRPTQVHLAFESACPDSQRFIVDRMYPRVLNNSYISQLVDFKAYPYGLAKRETAEKITCHHGERECRGNRLLTCMMSQLENDKRSGSEIFDCFMSLMFNKQQDPEIAINACMRRVGASEQIMQTVVACSKGQKATSLQRLDEFETRKILSQPRFVPFIQINGHSHIDMQAYQMIMPEKLNAWSSTLQRIVPGTDTVAGRCSLPPDFWCSSPSITDECFHMGGCKLYQNAIYGKRIHLKVIYSDSAASRNYVLGYIKRSFLLNSASNKKMQDKVIVELMPAASASNPCGDTSCGYQAVQHCVATHVKADIQTRNQMLLCLLETGGDMLSSWETRCHTFKPAYKDIVSQCAKSGVWKQEVQTRAQTQNTLFPEPVQSYPWVLVNGYSLSSVQRFSDILHRFICLWYRGPNHNRESCFRCEYEMTHCMGK